MVKKVENYITGYIKGKTPKMLFDKEENGCLPYLSPDYLRNISQPESYAQPDSKLVVVNEGEVIVLWDGSNAGEILISKKGILASTMTLLEFDENEIDKNYFGYSFQQLEYILKAKTAGSGIPHADKGVINKLNFYKPSLPEQASIANILSKVDEALESVKKSIEAAEKLKKSLMQNLLTGRMKPDGTLRTEEEFYEDEKFGKVPKGWDVKKVKNCFKFKNGKGNTTSNLKEIPDDEYCVPVYGGNGITGYYHSALLNKPTIIIGRVGEYCGNVFKTPEKSWVTDNAMLVSEVLMHDYNIDFFTIKLNSLNFKQYSDSTGQPKITQGSIGGIFITYPVKIEEQNNIIFLIDNVLNNIQQKQNKITALERLKKSLMQNLLTGKVRVGEEGKEKI